jgi:hypothetical protein
MTSLKRFLRSLRSVEMTRRPGVRNEEAPPTGGGANQRSWGNLAHSASLRTCFGWGVMGEFEVIWRGVGQIGQVGRVGQVGLNGEDDAYNRRRHFDA